MPPKRKSLAAEDSDSGDDFGGEDGEFRITNALKPSRATTYTAQALYDQIHTGDIILDPEYQRDVVWSKDKQTRLIDSILRNFYVPPVIFASNVKEDGAETKTCIDGKQRLTSILLFMDGQIPLIDPDTNQRLYYKIPPGDTKKKLLPDQYRRLFAYKQIVCVEYSDLSGQNERDIFQRVQLGVALTPSEKLQALDSPRCRFVRDLAGDDVVQNLPFEKKRAADFRVIAHVVHAIERMDWLSNVTDSHQLERWLQVDDEISSDLQQKIRKSVGAVAEMGLKPNGKAKRISPMELLAVLVFAHFRRLDGLDHTQLHSEVKTLRTALKAAFPELKLNGFCGRWAVEYINDMRGRSATGKAVAKRTKRRRTADDDDGDFNPQMLPSPS